MGNCNDVSLLVRYAYLWYIFVFLNLLLPKLSIFEYLPVIDVWENEDCTMRLTINEIKSANLTA